MAKITKHPTYDFFKHLNSAIQFEYSGLERAYNTYDASHAHRHDYFELIVFHESGGVHTIDFVDYPITKNTIHFISPGQVHLLCRKKNVTGHVLAFKPEIFLPSAIPFSERFLNITHFSTPVISLTKNSKQEIDKILASLIAETNKDHPYKVHTIGAYLLIFLAEVMKLVESTPDVRELSASKSIYLRFRKLLEKHYLSSHGVAEYASLLSITPGHLNDSVKHESGKNASELIHGRLVLEAKRMLYHSDKSIKEIAAFFHYDDPSYFIRFFRLHSGETPSEFRKKVRRIK